MSCPRNRNRWAGSGFRKEECQTNGLSDQMKKMMEERDKQDLRLFPQTPLGNAEPEDEREHEQRQTNTQTQTQTQDQRGSMLAKKPRVVETNTIVYLNKK